jgi:hypothetical protein
MPITRFSFLSALIGLLRKPADIDAFRLVYCSGHKITSGTVRCYGLAK